MIGRSNDINPARRTKWFIEKGGKIYRFYVFSIESRGVADKYEVISYELKYEFKEETQNVPAQKLLDMISSGIIKPDWDEDGTMVMPEDELLINAKAPR